MTSDAELVELRTTTTTMEAEWFVGVLKGFGIVAVTFGDQLTDEYAMSQKLMGFSGGVRVMVPRGQLERARQALVDIEQERPSSEDLEAALLELGDDSPDAATLDRDAETSGASTSTAMIVILGVVVAALGWLSVSQHRELSAYKQSNPVSEARWRGDGWESRWRRNDQLASIYLDRDGNGVFEELWFYDREGELVSHSVDENQNEIWELTHYLGPDGSERARGIDANENAITERVEYPAVDGVLERWLDADEDHRYERQEFVDVTSGDVLDAFEDRGREGYVRVK